MMPAFDPPVGGRVLSWLHIGDLHITRAGEQNYRDWQRVVTLAKGLAPGSLDFAALLGDNVDDGTPEQFRLVRDSVAALPMKLHILPGGPDFRLGGDQLPWAERELEAARAAGEAAVVFMHTYPADLRQGAERFAALLARTDVACVDMGHTHYNELANDGRTIFMAARSTGRVEEGPPGFSVAAVDGRA